MMRNMYTLMKSVKIFHQKIQAVYGLTYQRIQVEMPFAIVVGRAKLVLFVCESSVCRNFSDCIQTDDNNDDGGVRRNVSQCESLLLFAIDSSDAYLY